MYSSVTAALFALFGVAPCAAQIWPRQTSTFANTTSKYVPTSTASTASQITPPPCCWVYGGLQAVSFNTWYETTYSETIATVVRTILQYDDTTVVANSSTHFPTSIFTDFGFWGGAGGLAASKTLALPGIPTTLLGSYVTRFFNYGGTSVYPAGETGVNTSGLVYFANPTPYAIWRNVQYTTRTPWKFIEPDPRSSTPPPVRYDATDCGRWSQYPIVEYGSQGWAYETASVLVPYTGYMDTETWTLGPERDQPSGQRLPSFAVALPAPLPNTGVYVNMPTDAWKSMGSSLGILEQYPGITDCWTLPGEGQPTVHVPVAQLTGTSDHTITMGKALSTTSTQAVATSSTSASVAGPSRDTGSAQATASASSQSPEVSPGVHDTATQLIPPSTVAGNLPISSTASSASSRSDSVVVSTDTAVPVLDGPSGTSTTFGPTTRPGSPASSAPQVVAPGSDAPSEAPGSSGQTTLPGGPPSSTPPGVGPGSDTSAHQPSAIASGTPSLSPSPAVVAAGSNTLTFQPTGTAAAVVNGATLSVDGPAVTRSGQTLSLASGSDSPALVVNGQTASTLSTPAPTHENAPGQQTLTVGTQVYTASNVAATKVVIAGQTVYPDTETVIAGATVHLSSGSLVVASGTATTTIVLTATATKLITIGTDVITANFAPVSAIALGEHTVLPGVATAIDGETVSLSGSQLYVATSSLGLGGAIMSGIGGGTGTGTGSSAASVAVYTGQAGSMGRSVVLGFAASLIVLAIVV